MRVRRSRAASAAIALSLVGLTACDPPPPPVVLTVDSTGDGADTTPGDGLCTASVGGQTRCTLRAAAEEAAASEVDRIEVAVAEVALDVPLVLTPTAPTLTVTGEGVELRPTGAWSPVVQVASGGVVLDSIVVEGAAATGLAVDPGATLVLHRSRVVGTGGDGVEVGGTAVLVESEVLDSAGSGVWATEAAVVRLVRSSITGGAGAAIYATEWADSMPSISVVDSELAANVTGVAGWFGALSILRSDLRDHDELAVWADYRSTSPVRVVDSAVTGNGGGIDSGEGTISVLRSSLTDNGFNGVQASYASIRVEASLVAGSIYASEENSVTVVDSTLTSGWSAVRAETGATVTLTRSTVVGGWAALSGSDRARFQLAGTIVVATGTACDSGPSFSSQGGNLVGDGSCGLAGPGDVQGVDPLLGPLADNGGPTMTRLPGAGSPAIDAIPAGTPGLCAGTLSDQRGVARPQGAACDRGAVEQ